jgi:hypothetical protein
MNTIMVKIIVLVTCTFFTDGHHETRTIETKTGFMECMATVNALREFRDPDVIEIKAACLEWNAFVPGQKA